jgi:hypothetical protein
MSVRSLRWATRPHFLTTTSLHVFAGTAIRASGHDRVKQRRATGSAFKDKMMWQVAKSRRYSSEPQFERSLGKAATLARIH